MRLEFSGSPVIHATRDYVWTRVGAVNVRFNQKVELFDVVECRSLKMRSRGNGKLTQDFWTDFARRVGEA